MLRDKASEPLIDTYEGERRPLAAGVLRGTTTVTRMNIASNPIGRFVRDRIIVPVIGLAPIQRWITYTASQLWVSYRRPVGGTRAQAAARRSDRRSDLCPRGRHAVAAARRAGRPVGVASAERRRGRRRAAGGRKRLDDYLAVLRYDGQQAMLVRPDAHLAWRGDPEDTAGIDRWLDVALRDGRGPR